MKPSNKYLLIVILSMATSFVARARQIYLIEAEDFQFKGGWTIEQEGGKGFLNNQILRVLSTKTKAVDALTVI